jgi:RNA 2',3'-cyclic 3'-phosphodiesterase
MPDLIRSFIAIELPPPVLDALGALQDRLGRRTDRAAKWVAPQGIHLTLKFLGDVPAPGLAAVAEAMTRAARGAGPLSLHLAGAGCFPSPERARVIWVGLAGDLAALSRLQRSVEEELARTGFPPEDRGFTPHLTLARLRDTTAPQERLRLSEAARGLVVPAVDFTAGEICLIRSDLRPMGAVYTRLASAPLA